MKSARVILSPGEEIGEHVTENREEILLILRGEGSLVRSGQEIPIREGTCTTWGRTPSITCGTARPATLSMCTWSPSVPACRISL